MTQDTKPKVLPLDEISVGMSLAEPVVGAQGEVVLSQGVALTQALLHALRRRGVASLSVLVPDADTCSGPNAAADMDVKARLVRVERLGRLFRNDDGQSGTTRLRALVTQYRMEAMP